MGEGPAPRRGGVDPLHHRDRGRHPESMPQPRPATIRVPRSTLTRRSRSRSSSFHRRRQPAVAVHQSAQHPSEMSKDRRENPGEHRLVEGPGMNVVETRCHRQTSAGALARSVSTLTPTPTRMRCPPSVSIRSGRMPPSFRPSASRSFGQRIPSELRAEPQLVQRVDHRDGRRQGQFRLRLRRPSREQSDRSPR